MELGPREIHDKQFHDEWRGYNREEVDDFLDRAADALDQAQRSVQSLTERVRELEGQLGQAREGEQMLKKTLVTAQQHAEEAVATARREGREDGRGGRRARACAVGRSALQGRFGRVGGSQENTGDRAGERTTPAPARFLRGEAAARSEADTKQKLKAFLDAQQRALASLSERRTVQATTPRPAGTAAGQQEPRAASARPQERAGPARRDRRKAGPARRDRRKSAGPARHDRRNERERTGDSAATGHAGTNRSGPGDSAATGHAGIGTTLAAALTATEQASGAGEQHGDWSERARAARRCGRGRTTARSGCCGGARTCVAR